MVVVGWVGGGWAVGRENRVGRGLGIDGRWWLVCVASTHFLEGRHSESLVLDGSHAAHVSVYAPDGLVCYER